MALNLAQNCGISFSVMNLRISNMSKASPTKGSPFEGTLYEFVLLFTATECDPPSLPTHIWDLALLAG